MHFSTLAKALIGMVVVASGVASATPALVNTHTGLSTEKITVNQYTIKCTGPNTKGLPWCNKYCYCDQDGQLQGCNLASRETNLKTHSLNVLKLACASPRFVGCSCQPVHPTPNKPHLPVEPPKIENGAQLVENPSAPKVVVPDIFEEGVSKRSPAGKPIFRGYVMQCNGPSANKCVPNCDCNLGGHVDFCMNAWTNRFPNDLCISKSFGGCECTAIWF